ncbi:MAG: tetratricopeptide repeat protein [Myxococcales bacterium]
MEKAKQALEARAGKGAFSKAQEALSSYARALAQAQADLCLADRPAPLAALLAGRERCLAERRGNLEALVEVLGEAKVSPEVAAEAFARMPSIESCTAALGADRRWPAIEGAAAVAAKLSKAEALRLTGGATEAIRLADEARTAAEAAHLEPLAARAMLTQNLAVLETVPEPMEPMLHEAAAAAEAAGEPLAAARAWAAILAGLSARHDPEAINAALHAKAFLAAAGTDAAIASRIEAGRARAMAGRLEGALDAAEEAVLLAEALPSLLARSNAYSVRAEALCASGRCADALPDVMRAADLLEAGLGKAHRQTAAGLLDLARVLHEGRQPAQARPVLERAKAAAGLAFGETSSEVALVLNAKARNELAADDAAAAEKSAAEALALQEAAGGKESPELAAILAVQARAMREQERCEQALPLLERAQKVSRALQDVDAVAREEALCQLALARPELAVAALERVFPSRRTSADYGAVMGRALWEKGEKERGRALVEDAAARGSEEARDWLKVRPPEEARDEPDGPTR